MVSNIKFAERFAQHVIGRSHDSLPTRLEFLCAGQRLGEEVEVFVHEIARKFWRHAVNEMPAQISFPIIHRDAAENLVRRFKEIGLPDIDVAGLAQLELLE